MPMNTPFAVFRSDFPNWGTQHFKINCGLSIYRGVLIQWDESRDKRILHVIDGLPKVLRDKVAIMQGHEGHLWIVWYPSGKNSYSTWVFTFGAESKVSSYGVTFKEFEVGLCCDFWTLEHFTVGEKHIRGY
jgi:hypothetical protein